MENEVKSKQLGDLIQEIIHHEVDVITESDWFVEQLDERIKRYFEETDEDEDRDPPDWTNGAVHPDSKYAGYREE